MIRYSVYTLVFLCINIALIQAQDLTLLKQGYNNYFQCLLSCYKAVFQIEYISGNLCTTDIQLSGKAPDGFTPQQVEDSLDCIASRCQTAFPPSVCESSSSTGTSIGTTPSPSTASDKSGIAGDGTSNRDMNTNQGGGSTGAGGTRIVTDSKGKTFEYFYECESDGPTNTQTITDSNSNYEEDEYPEDYLFTEEDYYDTGIGGATVSENSPNSVTNNLPNSSGPRIPPIPTVPGNPPISGGQGYPPIPTVPENLPISTDQENPPIPSGPVNLPIPTGQENPPIHTVPENPPISTDQENPPIPTVPENPPISTDQENPPIPSGPVNLPIPTGQGNPPIPAGPGNPTIPTAPAIPPISGVPRNPSIPAAPESPPIPVVPRNPPIPVQSGNPPIPAGQGNKPVQIGSGTPPIQTGQGNLPIPPGLGNPQVPSIPGNSQVPAGPNNGQNLVRPGSPQVPVVPGSFPGSVGQPNYQQTTSNNNGFFTPWNFNFGGNQPAIGSNANGAAAIANSNANGGVVSAAAANSNTYGGVNNAGKSAAIGNVQPQNNYFTANNGIRSFQPIVNPPSQTIIPNPIQQQPSNAGGAQAIAKSNTGGNFGTIWFPNLANGGFFNSGASNINNGAGGLVNNNGLLGNNAAYRTAYNTPVSNSASSSSVSNAGGSFQQAPNFGNIGRGGNTAFGSNVGTVAVANANSGNNFDARNLLSSMSNTGSGASASSLLQNIGFQQGYQPVNLNFGNEAVSIDSNGQVQFTRNNQLLNKFHLK